MSQVAESMKYLRYIINSDRKDRENLKNQIIKGIEESHNPDAYEGETEDLVNLLRSPDVEIIGFVPNIQYIRLDGSVDFLKTWWVHATQPTLIVKHKRLPLVFLAGPSLRWNKSVIKEVNPKSGIEKDDLIGFTG